MARDTTPLVARVRNGDANSKRLAAAALGNLAFNSDAHREAIVVAGGLVPLVVLVRDGDADGKMWAATTLKRIAGETDAYREAIVTARDALLLVVLERDGGANGNLAVAGTRAPRCQLRRAPRGHRGRWRCRVAHGACARRRRRRQDDGGGGTAEPRYQLRRA